MKDPEKATARAPQGNLDSVREFTENLNFDFLGGIRIRTWFFRIDRQYPAHRHDAVEILLSESLMGQLLTPHKRYRLHLDRALVIPCGLVHSTWMKPVGTKGKQTFMQISSDLLRDSLDGNSHEGEDPALKILLHGNEAFEIPVSGLSEELKSLGSMGTATKLRQKLAWHSFLNDFLKRLTSKEKGQGEKGSPFRARDTDEIVAYLQEHYTEAIDLADLAARLGVSQSHMSRRFHQTTGRTLTDYIRFLRIAHAMKLLEEEGALVHRVGQVVGYSDINHFTRSFRLVTGRAPKQFQKAWAARAHLLTSPSPRQ